MAITWGAWRYSGGNGMRVGIEVTTSAVNTNSNNVTFTIRMYTQNQYRYSDPQWLVTTGSTPGGNCNFNNTQAGAATQRCGARSLTVAYPANSYGSSPGSRTFGIALRGAYNGIQPSVSVTRNIPARPTAAPNAPTGINAVRTSDTNVRITWNRTATAQRPWNSVTLQARVFTGNSWGDWGWGRNVASGYNWPQTGNRALQFRVRANNGNGSSGWNTSGVVYMRPAAPSNVRATVAAGGNVNITWNNNNYRTGVVTLQVQRQLNNGGWVSFRTGLANNATATTDTDSVSGSRRYRVRSIVGSLGSDWVNSNTVTPPVPPRAPSNLTPNNAQRDLDGSVTLTWRHVDGGDGSAQANRQIRVSSDGGITWITLTGITGALTAQSATVPAGVWPKLPAPDPGSAATANGRTWRWQVRTQSASMPGTWSPWSASATLTGVGGVPEPEPGQPPPVPPTTVENPNVTLVPLPGRLGAGDNTAYIYDQRGEHRLLELTDVSALSWNRVLNGISEASVTVTVPGDANYANSCCGQLGNIHTWHHSLVIYRNDGEGNTTRVWEGPIRRIGHTANSATIDAKDVLAWVEKRRRHTYRTITDSPVAAEMLVAVRRAFGEVIDAPNNASAQTHDPNVLRWVGSATGQGPRTVGGSGADGRPVSRTVEPNDAMYLDDLTSLADLGGRFTTVGRSILLFHDQLQLGRTRTLWPLQHLASEITIVEDGDVLVTSSVSRDDDRNAAIFNVRGTPVDPFYGQLDIVNSIGYSPATAQALQTAARTYADQNYPAPLVVDIPQDSTLACDSPFPIEHLVPGVIVPIESRETCRDVRGIMILGGVAVRQNAGSAETVGITLTAASAALVEVTPMPVDAVDEPEPVPVAAALV